MDIFKEILNHEVYPALGCTEPTACAYAGAIAAEQLDEPIQRISLVTDPGTYKNGVAVVVPNSGGKTGNLIAAILGACIADSGSRLEVLKDVTPEIQKRATRMLADGQSTNESQPGGSGFNVSVSVYSANHQATVELSGGHTFIKRIEKDGATVFEEQTTADAGALSYRQQLRKYDFKQVLALVDHLDADDMAYIARGIKMNLAMAERGRDLAGTANQLQQIKESGYLAEDMFFRTKIRIAAAVDARMSGLEQAVMTSGGSGNQGILTTLSLYSVGTEMGVSELLIQRSIAVAHAINAYIKSFVGELAVICGCAMAAGIAAAAGIVYQQAGPNIDKITFAVNNVIGDLSGLICDGAKPGCALKAVSSVDAAMRSALMALGGFSLSTDEGVVGRTVEDSIRNLGRITLEGMLQVDPTVIDILRNKAGGSGMA
jgi:L-cysteine desulfidase